MMNARAVERNHHFAQERLVASAANAIQCCVGRPKAGKVTFLKKHGWPSAGLTSS
jgi:hypothetical protein